MQRYPAPLKNLFWNSTQCSLRVCKKHSSTSIIIKTANVTAMKGNQIKNEPIVYEAIFTGKLFHGTCRISYKNASASCECASDNAHRRKYDAVLDTQPSTNSMVSISQWINTSCREWPWTSPFSWLSRSWYSLMLSCAEFWRLVMLSLPFGSASN